MYNRPRHTARMTHLMRTLGAVGTLALAAGCGTLTGGGGPERTTTPTKATTPRPTASATPASTLSLPQSDDDVCELVSKRVLKSLLGIPRQQPGDDVDSEMRATATDCEWRNRTPEGEGAGKQRNLTITVRQFRAGPDETGKTFSAVQWAKGAYYQSFKTAEKNAGTTEKPASTKTTYGPLKKIRGIRDQNVIQYERSVSSLQRNGGITVYIQVENATVTISYRGYDQAPGGALYDGSANKPMSSETAMDGAVKVARDVMAHLVKG